MLSACVSTFTYHMCNIMSQATTQLQSFGSFWSFVGQATVSIVLCCPDGEKVDDILLLQVTAANCRTACSVIYLFIQDETESLLQLQLAWPTCC